LCKLAGERFLATSALNITQENQLGVSNRSAQRAPLKQGVELTPHRRLDEALGGGT
jgi:hypothetical protein